MSDYTTLYHELVKLYKRSQRMPHNRVLEREIERLENRVPPLVREAAMLDSYFETEDNLKRLHFEHNNRIDGMTDDEILEKIYSLNSVPDHPFNHFYAARKSDVQLFKVQGDSMEPTICDGDHVSIFKTQKIHHGRISLVQVPEGKLLKRIEPESDGYLLTSDNRKHPTMYVPHGGMVVVGIVVHIIMKV